MQDCVHQLGCFSCSLHWNKWSENKIWGGTQGRSVYHESSTSKPFLRFNNQKNIHTTYFHDFRMSSSRKGWPCKDLDRKNSGGAGGFVLLLNVLRQKEFIGRHFPAISLVFSTFQGPFFGGTSKFWNIFSGGVWCIMLGCFWVLFSTESSL